MDPWAVLGVPPNASEDDIRSAYRRLAAKHHPDRPGGDARRMAEINAALDAIRHPAPVAVRPAGPSASAPSAEVAVEGAGSDRPVGCVVVAAVAAVVVAATVAIAVAISSRGSDSPRAASTPAPAVTTTPATPRAAGGVAEPPPWAEARLPRTASPLAASQWQLSEARDTCPLIVPVGADAGGTTRALQVPNGWGVAWGRPNEQELFGVTARLPSGRRGRPQAEAALTWTDGSAATLYRDGNRLVADLTIAGVDCRYGVFSTLGFDHLAEVLGAIRFVRT